jgi:hypothetical protein
MTHVQVIFKRTSYIYDAPDFATLAKPDDCTNSSASSAELLQLVESQVCTMFNAVLAYFLRPSLLNVLPSLLVYFKTIWNLETESFACRFPTIWRN